MKKKWKTNENQIKKIKKTKNEEKKCKKKKCYPDPGENGMQN